MKKLFIGGLMGLIIFPSLAVSVHAQTTQVELTPEAKTELISEIKLQIQALILELIQVLQQQLNDLIAAQSQQGEQLNQIQNAVSNIQPSPSPVLGGTGSNPAPAPTPEQITIKFTVANQAFDSPFTTSWRFISLGFLVENIDACPAGIRITTDNPDGFAALNDDHNTDVTFPSGRLSCKGGQDLLMNTSIPGTYHVNVTDLDTGVSALGEFTILPRE